MIFISHILIDRFHHINRNSMLLINVKLSSHIILSNSHRPYLPMNNLSQQEPSQLPHDHYHMPRAKHCYQPNNNKTSIQIIDESNSNNHHISSNNIYPASINPYKFIHANMDKMRHKPTKKPTAR